MVFIPRPPTRVRLLVPKFGRTSHARWQAMAICRARTDAYRTQKSNFGSTNVPDYSVDATPRPPSRRQSRPKKPQSPCAARVYVAHGLSGTPEDLTYLKQSLEREGGSEILVHSARRNEGKTKDGVVKGGSRLAEEVRQFAETTTLFFLFYYSSLVLL